MLVDSHCHLNFLGLSEHISDVLQNMQMANVGVAVVIGVNKEDRQQILSLLDSTDNLYATLGVHPDNQEAQMYTEDELVELAMLPKIIGIGETGLDYHWCKGDLTWQHERFRLHIRAAKRAQLPLVVHTREAAEDTLSILNEYGAVQGVMHCFTESVDIARRALDLGMYLSFSGIVTFKNATQVKEVAAFAPLERILIETDSPYLAPVPHRGKQNEPAYVRYVAECIAQLRNISFAEVEQATTDNFFSLFNKALQK